MNTMDPKSAQPKGGQAGAADDGQTATKYVPLEVFKSGLAALVKFGEAVSDRLDAIAETMTSTCNTDMTDDASDISLPVHEADALDAMRSKQPILYAKLIAAADQVWGAPPIGRRRLAVQLANQLAGTK